MPFPRVRRCIGMGGDKLMPAVAGIDEESRRRRAHLQETRRDLQGEVPAAPEALPRRRAGWSTPSCLAVSLLWPRAPRRRTSSAPCSRLRAPNRFTQLPRATMRRGRSRSRTSSRPRCARRDATPGEAVMIGDTPYDLEAASRAGVNAIAFRCGGWTDADLSGAIAIYDGPWDLLARLDRSLLGGA